MYDSGSSLEEAFATTSLGYGEQDEGFSPANGESSKKPVSNGHIPNGNHKALKLDVEEKRRKYVEEEDEEILKESDSRFVLFPIRFRSVCLFQLDALGIY